MMTIIILVRDRGTCQEELKYSLCLFLLGETRAE